MRRHDLVYLQHTATLVSPCVAADSPAWEAARLWLASGLPLVATRQPSLRGLVQLGLSLPLRLARQRLTIQVAEDQIARISAPLTVARCRSRLPTALAGVLEQLDEEILACGARLGVFGSLSWENLSGEIYRHAESDIDLICDVASHGQLLRSLEALKRAAAELPCRLDGELRLPDGRAVAWQEVAACYPHGERPVLVKGEQAVELLALDQWLSVLQLP